MMGKVLADQPIAPGESILHHPEGVDLMPADIQLSGMEVSLVNAMSRETVLRQYLPAKGLEQLLQTINKVHRQINPKMQIDGILLTMVDNRTNFAKDISALLRDTYGGKIKVFGTEIPHSVRTKETSAEGNDPGGKVAEADQNLTKEVLKIEKQREKCKAGIGR